MTLAVFTVASLTASALFFAMQKPIRTFRYARLEREVAARWGRLDIANKIEVVRRLGGAPLTRVRPEEELDQVFHELWGGMRRQKSFDLEWIEYRLTAAGI